MSDEEAAVEAVQQLTSDCGHHCGAFTPDHGGARAVVGHCVCAECHGAVEEA